MNYKISFAVDIAFQKSRLKREYGDCSIGSDLSIDEMKEDKDLGRFIGMEVNKKYKTGQVINVEIKGIQIN